MHPAIGFGKEVTESCERETSALGAFGLGLPPKHIMVKRAPANLVRESSDIAIRKGE